MSLSVRAFKTFHSSANSPNPLMQSKMQSSATQQPADLVLKNARIYTMDAKHPWASAVALGHGKILAVDDSENALTEFVAPTTRVIDLQGAFVMPGFNDAHVHLASAGYARIKALEVDVEGVHSLAEFQQRIRERLPDFKPGEWMTGRGWDHTLWPDKKFPTRADLDAVAADRPMFFARVDGHVAVVNSLSLRIAGITRTTADPPGGHIERDAQGEPTGLLEEDAAMSLVTRRVPQVSQSRRRQALQAALDEASKHGVTSVQDYSVQNVPDDNSFGCANFVTLQEMKREGKLNVRVTEWLPFAAPLEKLQEMRRAGGTSDEWVKTGALKEFLDGSLGSRTAALLAPYSDAPGTSGILRVDPKELQQMSIERDRAGFQIAFHAIGDRANRLALDTFEAVLKANGPRDRRDRVEHAQIVSPIDLPRFASLGVIASMQPSHLLDDERWVTDRLGPERLGGAYAWHTLLASGAHLAFGTDFPVESINPLRGIYACVTRELPEGGPAGGWQPQEKLNMEECLRAYTVGAAYAEFEENRKGVIAPGMLADLVVFRDDITRIPAAMLLREQASMTIAGGRIVYERP
jgi:predicted amidohydrolase YtcJ